MNMTPARMPTREEVAEEDCSHCGVKAEQPCINFGDPGAPMPSSYEFHSQRTHAAVAKRLRVESEALIAGRDLYSIADDVKRGAVLYGPFSEVRCYDREGIKQWAFQVERVKVQRWHHYTGRWQVLIKLLPSGSAYGLPPRKRGCYVRAEIYPGRYVSATGRGNRAPRGSHPSERRRRGCGGRKPVQS